MASRRRGSGHVDLTALPDLFADAAAAGHPIVLERITPLPAHAQRLMDTLGVEVQLVTSTSHQHTERRTRGRTMGSFDTGGVTTPAHTGPRADWIDYRASKANRYRRIDAGETVTTCPGCQTEIDVDDVVHSPKCAVFLGGQQKTKAADWDQNTAITAIRLWADEHDGEPPGSEQWRRPTSGYPTYAIVVQLFGSWNDGIAAAGFEPRSSNRRERLEEREPQADESHIATPVDESDSAMSSSSVSSPSSVATVGVDDGSRSSSRKRPVSVPAIDTIAAGDFTVRNRRRVAYSREEVIGSFARFHRERGRAPVPSDIKTCAYLPTGFKRATAELSGFGSWQAVWTHFGWGKVPTGQAVRRHVEAATAASEERELVHAGIGSRSSDAEQDSSGEGAVDLDQEEGPRSPTPDSGEPDEQQPQMRAPTAAATDAAGGLQLEPGAGPDRDTVLGLNAAHMILAGETLSAIADVLVRVPKRDRRIVWQAVAPLVDEVLDA